ncbi:MAG: ATP-binding protein [Desulfosarcinaceae bacterium]|nr:ATP-binding protein [Desulfosarcinaceae bacterium]
MARDWFPLHHRILFRLLLPIVVVGLLVSTVLVGVLSAPMKDFLTRQFDANLRLSATLGLRICEESFGYLLDLRLEKDSEMNRTMQNEALVEVRNISDDFPHIHLMVVNGGQMLAASNVAEAPQPWNGPELAGIDDTRLGFQLADKAVRAHVQYFPFWDWHIISFVFDEAYQQPLAMAYRVTYLSAVGVFFAVVATLLGVFFLFIKRPLNRLVAATEGVAEGRPNKLEAIPRSEFGQLMQAFNDMIDSLAQEKAAVRDLIQQLRSIYNSLPIIVWSLDEKGIFTLSEGKELKSLGLAPGQVVGQSVFTLYKDNPVIVDAIKQGLNGNACEFESIVQGHHFHTVITPVLDEEGRVKWVNGLALNVTERRRAEEELHQLRNYLSNIIDSMPSVLIGVDRDGIVTQWNSEAQRATGIAAKAATGQPLAAAFPRLAARMARIHEAIATRQVCSDPRQAWETEGETRYENVTIYPLVADGAAGAVIRVDDVTEQVRLEEMMIQGEKMLSVGGLAAGMAHEINNPLAGILQNATVLRNRLSGDLRANHEAAEAAGTSMASIQRYLDLRKLPEMLENIQASGAMAAAIVKNMLGFARKSEGVASTHDLRVLLDQAVELLNTDYDMKRHYDFKQIQIIREYDAAADPVTCEASKLQQVFMNVLRNGAEAMAAATTARVAPAFTLRVRDDGDHMRVEIEDNGPGMDEKTRRRIFEPFYTTKPTGEGTGLGLSVSYFIVADDHGGEMWVLPARSGGSCFVIRLPKEGSA